jgi:hypothetical protein
MGKINIDEATLNKMREIIQRVKSMSFEEYAGEFYYIVDKEPKKAPLKLNNIQRKIEETINELEAAGKPVRIIILKPRQTGVSTYVQAKFFNKTTTKRNRTALVVAHTDIATNSIFNKTKFIYDNMKPVIVGAGPDDIDFRPLRKASNARELIFDKPSQSNAKKKGLNSRFKIATAGGTGIGRGDTHNYVHLSEFAWYEHDIKEIFIGIMQSVPKSPDTCVIIESTANGFNEFYNIWKKACENKNDFIPLFFAWHDFEEYKMPCTPEERTDIMNNLNEYEKFLVDTYKVTAEQLKWYRWSLENDCAGDHDLMKQENPSFQAEAFLHTGRPVFDNDKVQARKEALMKEYEKNPPEIGVIEVVNNQYKFVPDKNGTLIIYEHPKHGYPYTIGGDIAEGLRDGDWSVSVVCDNTDGHIVAKQRLHIHPDLFADEQIRLGRYYNEALISDEINNHGHTTITALKNSNYRFMYKREVFDRISRTKQQKYGFDTKEMSRKRIIDRLRQIVRDEIYKIPDLDILDEMLTFIYNDQGKEEAEEGCHDDCVLATAIMYEAQVSGQQRMTVPQKKIAIDDTKWIHPSVRIDAEKNPQMKRYLEKVYGRK